MVAPRCSEENPGIDVLMEFVGNCIYLENTPQWRAGGQCRDTGKSEVTEKVKTIELHRSAVQQAAEISVVCLDAHCLGCANISISQKNREFNYVN